MFKLTHRSSVDFSHDEPMMWALRAFFVAMSEQDVQQNNRIVRTLRHQDTHVMSLHRIKQMDQHTRCLHLSQYNFNKRVLLTELYEILHELH